MTTTLIRKLTDVEHQKLLVIAKQQERSLNRQLLFIVRQFIQQYEQEHGVIDTTVDTDDRSKNRGN